MTSNPRVAVLANRFPEISETFVMDQFRALLHHGFDAHMYAESPREGNVPPGWDSEVDLKVRVHWYPQPSPIRILRLPAAKWLAIRAGEWALLTRVMFGGAAGGARFAALLESLPFAGAPAPDLIHAQFGPNGLRALRLKKLGVVPPATPLIVTFHGYDVNRSPQRYGKGMYREVFADACSLTCGSQFMARSLLQMGAPEEKLHVIPMGIDTVKFRPAVQSIPPPGPGQALRILTVGRLAVEKGLVYAVEALAELKARGIAAHWTFVGGGPLRSELEALAEKIGLREQLEFTGPLSHSQIPAAMQRAHVFVLPSIKSPDGNIEGQGLVLAEAQACGLPVVATRVGGIPESLVEDKTGFLVSEKAPAELASALERFAVEPSLIASMGEKAHTWASGNFDRDQLSCRFAALVQKCLTVGK